MADDPKQRADQTQIDDHLYEIDDGDDEGYDDDWLDEECGLMDDGQCRLAGTEHCDFTCPWRDSEDFAGSAGWIKKHEDHSR